ncbi:MAG TPA: HEAT repeat domain-containing protein [Pirellulales bacterium]|nr:HEAT repeat domain-containing protein [Pirellulales bacterium]
MPGEREEGSKLLWVILAASGGLIGTLLVLTLVAISDDRGAALQNAEPAVDFPAAEPVSPAPRVLSRPLQVERYDELDRLVAELGPGQRDASRKRVALEKLLTKQFVNADRAPVLKAVEPLMLDPDPWLRRSAIEVAGAWGGKETVPVLVALLVQLDPNIRRSAIESLGKIKDVSAAEALAPLMTNSSDRHSAMQALESLGEIAEPAVLKLLNYPDNDVRFDVCRVLGKIGGRNSVAAMKSLLLRERDHQVKFGAELALRDLGQKGL